MKNCDRCGRLITGYEYQSYGGIFCSQECWEIGIDLKKRIEKLEKEKEEQKLNIDGIWARVAKIDLENRLHREENQLTKDDIKAIKQASDVYKRYMDTASVDEIKEVYKEPEKKEVIRKCCYSELCNDKRYNADMQLCATIIGAEIECEGRYLVEETV
jgi:hypothetical protein